jgi:N-acetylglutamate synthase-like GNAT family acetyltransferase
MPNERPHIREAKPGDEKAIHEAHMRSIREICVKDHGEEEVRGWGNRSLGDRWANAIKEGFVWVVESGGNIFGHAYIRIFEEGNEKKARIHGLYLTPEVLHQGFGFQLAKMMLGKARVAGTKFVTLESSITAHDFYQRVGFNDSGPMKLHEIGGSYVRGFPMIFNFS